MATSPDKLHAINTAPVDPHRSNASPGEENIPEPIMIPTTIATPSTAVSFLSGFA
jgi:hypothetical protein